MSVHRLHRVLLSLTALGVVFVVGLWISYHFVFHRLTSTNFFISFSLLVLLSFLVILLLRYGLLMWFSYLHAVERQSEPRETPEFPFVTILVPAFNESSMIEKALTAVLSLDYPRFEVVVIDDGSTDDTLARALRLSQLYGEERVRVIGQPNSGKAVALNQGLAVARGEIVLCMDGDSRLSNETLRQGIKHFCDPSVGAVAGNVKVVNRRNTLTCLQSLEYIEGLNMVRAAQAFLSGVNIIPGPLGLFRRSALQEIGGYQADTFAEDCDLTLRLLQRGWKIKYEPQAISWTEAPETVHALIKQRYRWTRGILQALGKQKAALWRFRRDPIACGMLWYMLFEGILWPAMNVFANCFFLFMAWWMGLSSLVVLWWAQLTLLDVVAATYCVSLEREDQRLIPYAVLYRLYFILLVDVTKFLATIDEFFKVPMTWGKLERLGRI